jgi:hypothetical protein
MKTITDVKLGFSKSTEVMVTANVDMNEGDKDDLYFVMFNILDNPLRFVVAVAGNFRDFLVTKGYTTEEIDKWLETTPETYLEEIVKHQVEIMQNATERVRIPLDSKANSDQARLVVTSMISQGYFKQVSMYRFPNGEEDPKVQKVPTKEMSRDLNIMLEVIKNWEDFNYEDFMKEMVKRYG